MNIEDMTREERIARIENAIEYLDDQIRERRAEGNEIAVLPLENRRNPLRAALRRDRLESAERLLDDMDMMSGWQDPAEE